MGLSVPPKAGGMVAGVLAASVWCGGCVAFDAGRTETIEHVESREVADATPSAVSVEDARVHLKQTGNHAEVRISADVREEHPVRRHVKRVVVRKRKRLAFGFFPGAAELVWMPKGALASGVTLTTEGRTEEPEFSRVYGNEKPGLGTYAFWEAALSVGTCGIIPAVATCESLLLGLFAPWECPADVYDPGCFRRDAVREGKAVAVASESPKLRALAALPEREKRAVGANTCFDPQPGGMWAGGHLAWFGFHKFCTVRVELPPEERGEAEGRETWRRKAWVEGPFEVELSIPALRHSQTQTAARGEGRVVFDLPRGDVDGEVDAVVRVRECGGTSGLGRMAIRNLAGQNSGFSVALTARAPSGADGEYRVVGIRPGPDGSYAIQVEVSDETRAMDVALAIEGEVRRRIREDFARRHPGERTEHVRDQVEWRLAEGRGNLLEFEGRAFSVRPLARGWHYDGETRQGIVRLAVSPGVPREEALRWARENIGSIVEDKGVGLEAGAAPPPGARFEVLEARYEAGVLSVAFRVAE